MSIARNQKLQLENERIKDIIISMQDLYFKISRELILLEINPSCDRLLGYTMDELVGKSILSKVIQLSQNLRKQILKNNRNRSFQIRIVNRAGDRLTFDCKIELLLDGESGKLCFIGIAKDITDYVLAQSNLREKNKKIVKLAALKDQFLANMSHEIRTPLNGIIGLVDLLERELVNSEHKKYIGTIQHSSNLLLRIINDILDISKLETGKFSLQEESFSIGNIIKNTYNLYSAMVENSKVKYTFIVDETIPTIVVGDQVRLSQILNNLLSNAVKFTDLGEILLRADLESFQIEKSLCSVRFSVRDTGLGIKENKKKTLFQAFSQIDSSTSKIVQGTGLGLYISQNLVRLMGGNIEVASEYLKGSTFSFVLDFKVGSHLDKHNQETVSYNFESQNFKVLLVDDNATNLSVGKALLKRLNVSCDLASSGFDAIKLAGFKNYDIIFMDIQMPVMDGIETMFKIREFNLMPTSIVALTAYSMKADRKKYSDLGFDEYLSKPITSAKLADILSKFSKKNFDTKVNEEMVVNMSIHDQLENMIGATQLRSIYTDYIEETQTIIQSLNGSISRENLNRNFHTLKGSSSTIGFQKMADLAADLEKASSKARFTLSKAKSERICLLLEEFITFVNSLTSQPFTADDTKSTGS